MFGKLVYRGAAAGMPLHGFSQRDQKRQFLFRQGLRRESQPVIKRRPRCGGRIVRRQPKQPVRCRAKRPCDPHQRRKIGLTSASNVVPITSLIEAAATCRFSVRYAELFRSFFQPVSKYIHRNNLFLSDTYLAIVI